MLSLMGVLIGRRWGARKKHSAELFGGIILILLGLKIFLEHMGCRISL
ncbi:manganese efflux pump [Porphyromonas loveana]